MKDRQKKMFINMLILFILLILIGSYYLFSILPHEKLKETEGKVFLLPHFSKESVAGLNICYNNVSNKYLTVIDYISNQWDITKPKLYQANDEAVLRILNDLPGIKSERLLTNVTIDQLKEYGFNNPSITLEIRFSDSHEIEMLVGSKTPAEDLSYVIISTNSNSVYLVYDYKFSSLEKTGDEFKNTEIFNQPLQTINFVEIKKGPGILYQFYIDHNKNKEKWVMIKPEKKEINPDSLKEKMMDLYTINIQSFYDSDLNYNVLKKFGLINPFYTVRIASDDYTNRLLIGTKISNNIYAAFIPEKEQIIFIDCSDLIDKMNFGLTD